MRTTTLALAVFMAVLSWSAWAGAGSAGGAFGGAVREAAGRAGGGMGGGIGPGSFTGPELTPGAADAARIAAAGRLTRLDDAMGDAVWPIEICFVLDTTGSMSGLIHGAQQTIWAVSSEIVSDNPKCPLKIGLVGYRDRGDRYITKVTDLTDDLDAMYQALMTFQADGGGDTPESVNQALQEAVEKISWSSGPGIRLIFLVGDSPPHMNYPDDVKYPVTIEKAVKMGILVNTILCGSNHQTAVIWEEIARTGNGVYAALDQAGGTVALATPQDKRLAELGAQLADTVIAYGSASQRAQVAEKVALHKSMTAVAEAARVTLNFRTGGRAIQGKGDLVHDLQADAEMLAKLPAEELPEALAGMNPAECQVHIQAQLDKRKTINEQIAEVVKERDAYIAARLAEPAPPPAEPPARGPGIMDGPGIRGRGMSRGMGAMGGGMP